jgi:hypothetical protein
MANKDIYNKEVVIPSAPMNKGAVHKANFAAAKSIEDLQRNVQCGCVSEIKCGNLREPRLRTGDASF